MVGSIATTAVITNGLHCGPACSGIITSTFSLYCNVATVPPVVPPDTGSGGGGGYYPGPVQNRVDIQDFYTQTDQQYYQVPRDKEAEYFRKHVNVVVKIKLKDINIEKTYRVPEKRKYVIVKMFNVLNATQTRFVATVNNIKRIITKAEVIIRNIKVRKT